MTNIKLNNKKLITIIIANTKYAINSVPTQNVKAGNNIVQYKPIGKFSDDEKMLLNQSLKEGYVYINEAYSLLKKAKADTLKKAKADTLEKVEAILGASKENDESEKNKENAFEALLANIQQIQDKILSPKLVVLKENYLDTEKDHILASVKEDDTFTFTVYDNFFDKKEFKDNRAGVIIHEIAHLCDIEEGADMYDLDSAECLKNIILHLNNKITLDEIQAEYFRKQEPQERDDDTLTYDPDQARVPAGSSKGGQWTKGGSGGGSSSKENESKSTAKNKDNSDESNDKTKDNDIEKEQAKIFEALKEETRSFLENEGLSEEEINEKLEDISLEGMSEIFEEYFEEKLGSFKEIIKNSNSPLLASNGSFWGLFSSKGSGAVAIKNDKNSSIKYNSYEKESGISVSFTNADKEAEQNQGRQSAENKKEFIKSKSYSKDPSEAIIVSREYKNQKGLYLNTTARLEGFAPNKNYTIFIQTDCKYTNSDRKKNTENALVAYDVKSDENGCVILERLTLLTHTENKKDKISNVDFSAEFFVGEGRPENYYPINNSSDNLRKDKLSYLLALHAANPEYDDNANIQKDNQGGMCSVDFLFDDEINKKLSKAYQINIKIK